MQIYPNNALEQLDFPRLLRDISEFTAGAQAQEAIMALQPSDNLSRIERHFSCIRYFMSEAGHDRYLELKAYDVPAELHHCFSIEGYVLTKTGFLNVRHVLDNGHAVSAFFNRSMEENENVQIPFANFSDTTDLRKELHNIMDEYGEIKPTASETLMSITKKITKKQSEISTVFERIAKQSRSQGLLSDINESYRNGRRVLALPAENKRKLTGIIHGESESGKTVFIEPQAVTEVNNELFQLEIDRQKEEYKILQKLSENLRLHEVEVTEAIDILIEVDESRAKAMYSMKRDFEIPIFDPEIHVHLKAAFHPHLETHLKAEGKSIVKNNIILHGNNHILLLSGPNAGGKSVSLKTIAFAQLMFQCGLPVPAEGDSRMRLYSKLALDMGDNQSIEDDLSTYSSHLQHMRHMLEIADEHTLILIDEFGTGTDPRVGGALAESILDRFLKQHSTAVITTHYSNLKTYAHKMRGIVNGSMSFDMEKISPTYTLQIGKPGSSFAFEIAKRMGLPDDVIELARKKAGTQVYEMEKLLSQLTYEKEAISKKTEEIKQQERDLKTLTQTYTQLKSQLDIQRKKYKAERNEEMAKLKAENIKVLEGMIKEYKSLANTEKEINEKLELEKAEQMVQIEKARTLNREAHQMSGQWLQKEDLEVGAFVRIRDTDSSGKIISLGKKAARVAIGPLTVDVPFKNLVKAGTPLDVNRQRSIQYDKPQDNIPSRLDIRGMSFKEAEGILTQYFDDALVRHMHQVEILHGRGNGVLRKLVVKVAREFKDIRDVSHPEEDAGGEAMSIVTF
jgi:DNA mismatch repair protein MutS2